MDADKPPIAGSRKRISGRVSRSHNLERVSPIDTCRSFSGVMLRRLCRYAWHRGCNVRRLSWQRVRDPRALKRLRRWVPIAPHEAL